MFTLKVGSTVGAISRGSKHKWEPRQQPARTGEVVAGTVLLPYLPEKSDLLTLEAARAFAHSDNELEESHPEAQRLPVRAKSKPKLIELRRGIRRSEER